MNGWGHPPLVPLLRRLALSAFLLALAAPAAYARAGGGQSYSGGGGGFSSGGGGSSFSSGRSGYRSRRGSGDGGAAIIELYLLLMTRHPLVGWPVTLFALYMFYLFYLEGAAAHQRRAIARGVVTQRADQLQARLAALRARDPAFDMERFLERVGGAFRRVQEAWCAQDMAPARALLSDGVHERFAIYLAMQKAMGVRNRMEELSVSELRPALVRCDPHFDTIHVSIRAAAIDLDERLEDGRVVRNAERRSEEFVEVWSFLRRPGAKTLGRPGLLEGFCPSCGAPVEIKDAARCGACGSWISSGEYDWMLAEITQACEWSPREAERGAPGLAELQARDPALNVQFLEDRASLMFWRWQAAHWEAGAESLRPVALAACAERFLREQGSSKRLYRNAAVGAVELLAISAAEGRDLAHLLVKWSAEAFVARDGGAEPQGSVEFHHVFSLARKAGAATDARAGLRSSVCPGCGAPPAGRQEAACAYCGAPLNDGARQWTLAEVVPHGRWTAPRGDPTPPRQAPDARPAPASPGLPSAAEPADGWDHSLPPGEALAILVGGMVVDGQIDAKELELARDYARRHAVPERRLLRLVEAARTGGLEIPRPRDLEQAKRFLRGVIQMSLADGTISRRERDTLASYGRHLRLPPAELEAMIAGERQALYRRVRDGGGPPA